MNIRASNALASLIVSFGLTAGLPAPVAAQTATPAASAPNPPPARPASSDSASTPIPVDQIVAVVNDEVITRNELRRRTNDVEKVLRKQGTQLPPRDVMERQVLERVITERALLQEAKEDGLKVDDTQLDRAITRIAEQNHMDLAAFRARVEGDGEKWPQFRTEVRNEILMSRLRDKQVESGVQVSEGEIDNLIAEQTGANIAQEYNIAQILVRVPEQSTAEQIEAARKKADDLYTQIQGGADFGKLAVSFSDAPEALSGGEFGWRPAERYPQVFIDAVKDFAPGQVARPFKSQNGFHILKLVSKRRAVVGASKLSPVQQTHVRHILIRVNEVMSADLARQRLNDIRQRILSGSANFADMAKSYSNDGSASKGGDLGYVLPGDTVPEFERAMNALKIDEISEPVQTPFGLHIIQVLERKSEAPSSERVRNLARTMLKDRKAEAAYEDWVRSIRDRAYVEIRLDDR